MKLYDLPRDKNTKLYGLKDLDGKENTTLIFGHLDGAYSYCWIEGEPEKVVHLSASTPLEQFKDGYKVVEEEK